ncbi:elongation factor P, partial [Candidatus Omnitrophota bacterium]
MITARQFRQGGIINYNGQLHEVVEAQHHKPGKGGAFIRAKLKNLSSGSIASVTLRPEDTFDEAFIEQKQMQYLYKDDLGYCFMDEKTYEQVHVSGETIGDKIAYMRENMTITAKLYEGKILAIEPPIHVVLKVAQT